MYELSTAQYGLAEVYVAVVDGKDGPVDYEVLGYRHLLSPAEAAEIRAWFQQKYGDALHEVRVTRPPRADIALEGDEEVPTDEL
jgi:hypothetical protein